MKRRIAIFTGTRAEYGLLYWLMKDIQASNRLDLQVIVSGMHLTHEYGETWRTIDSDGFPITARIHMQLSSDSAVAVTKSMGLGLIGMADAFDRLVPDILVILGDRYEALVAAQAAMLARIPIAHIHGGEATEGLIDEAIRHSITKMSHLHFVAADDFRNRVIQLGEHPDRVWNVGATGLDNIEKLTRLSREELALNLGMKMASPLFLLTYHPVTLQADDRGSALKNLLEVVDEFDGCVVITGTNADAGGNALRRVAQQYVLDHPGRALAVESMGSMRYLSLMACADVVVGNSSSGLIEAPAVGTPTVDLGNRQSGRLRAPSVIHAEETKDAIRAALSQALSVEHKALASRRLSLYGSPGAARRISSVLAEYPLEGLLQKSFFDLR